MRKIIVYNVISLDGYHTGSGNDVSVMFPIMGKVFDSYNAELLRTADVHLMGRVSFELFQSFWPKVAENPTSDEWTDSQRDLSQASKSVQSIVARAASTPKAPPVNQSGPMRGERSSPCPASLPESAEPPIPDCMRFIAK